MKSLAWMIVIVITLGLCSGFAAPQSNLYLTDEEVEWLKDHPVIRYAPDPEFGPYEFFRDDQFTGIMSDYVHLLEDMLDVDIQVVRTESWTQTLDMARSGQVDMILGTKTKERSEYLYFTSPFINAPNIILVNENNPVNVDPNAIDRYEIGVIENYAVHEFLEIIYPAIELRTYDTVREGLADVAFGNIEGFVVDFGQGSFYANDMNLTNLISAGEIAFEYKLSLGVTKDKEPLYHIIEKALRAIPKTEKDSIQYRWISVDFSPALTQNQIRNISIVFVVIVLASLSIIVWNRSLQHQVKQKTKDIHQINAMLEEKVRIRTMELESTSEELKASLVTLQNTQDQLIESEKYAALGELVSGVAHEINTPIGNCITSVTYELSELDKVKDLHGKGPIDPGVVGDYLDRLTDVNTLIFKNLKRVASIISRFKILEISKISNNQEAFELADTVETAVEIAKDDLHNLTKQTYEVKFKPRDRTLIFGSKAWIHEIIGNLMQNSLLHGFDLAQPGLIEVIVERIQEKYIRIVYEDNGRGIEEEELDRVFEPFHSTKKTDGAIGLGLSIVYNIVVRDLNGCIHLTSVPDEYTRITIDIPIYKDTDKDAPTPPSPSAG